MARLRTAPSTQTATARTRSTRQALKEKTNTVQATRAVQQSSEDLDNIVKDAHPRKGLKTKKLAPNGGELAMTGALGLEEAAGAEQSTSSDGISTANARQKRQQSRTMEKPLGRQAQSESVQVVKKLAQTTTSASTPAGRAQQRAKPAAQPASDSVKRRSSALPSDRPMHDRSEFSISPSPPPPGKLSTGKDRRSSATMSASVMRSRTTPVAETSTLALKSFKRRPRQPSMLQMVQQRTASARPSTMNASAIIDPAVYDGEGIEDDDEDFAPDAEGTPLHVRGGTSKVPVIQTKKRKSNEMEVSASSSGARRSKRPKASITEAEQDSRVFPNRGATAPKFSEERGDTPEPQVAPDVQVINSSPMSSSPIAGPVESRGGVQPDVAVPSTEEEQLEQPDINPDDAERQQDQDELNSTMAEPASSPPLPAEPMATQRTDVMADPLTQVSPPRKREATKRKANEKPMTTATLQSLLPKRRKRMQPRHRKSEYDIEPSSDAEVVDADSADDEIELDQQPRRQTKASASSKSRRKSFPVKSKARQSKATAQAKRKSTTQPARKPTAPAKKPGKTYSRAAATTSDKENEDLEDPDENDDSLLPDNSISMVEAAQSKELEEARKKFAEVDAWDMEFESMSFEEGRSSSQNWR